MSKWIEIGTIGVDAGLCWIGDPCYLHDSLVAGNWEKFTEWLWGADGQGFKGGVRQHRDGCVVETGWGDGCYPVEVRRNDAGRVAEVRVVFDPGE